MNKKHAIRLGKKFEQFRKARSMTLLQLSQLSKVQLATISRIENDLMTGTLETHIRLVKALGVRLADLYAEIDQENAQAPGGISALG